MSAKMTVEKKIFLVPGQIMLAEQPTVLSTVLGSCVSICLYDPVTRIGGMNHYKLPFQKRDQPGLYGESSIAQLLAMFNQKGIPSSRLVATIVGGNSKGDIDLGKEIAHQNRSVAIEQLKKNDVLVKNILTGQGNGQKLVFHTGENSIDISLIA